MNNLLRDEIVEDLNLILCPVTQNYESCLQCCDDCMLYAEFCLDIRNKEKTQNEEK